MRPVKVCTYILPNLERIVIGKSDKRDRGRSTKGIPKLDLIQLIQYTCLLKNSSYNCFSNGTPANLLLPSMLVHLLLVQLQKYPTLVPSHVESHVWVVRYLTCDFMADRIIYVLEWSYLCRSWGNCYLVVGREWQLFNWLCERLMGKKMAVFLLN